MLFTVEGFLGTDYPALLDEAVGRRRQGSRPRAGGGPADRADDGARRRRRPRATRWSTWEVFLQEGGACSADVAAGRTASITSGDLSDLVFTSGTTGRPKGAMTTHGQTLRTFATWSEVVGLRQGDRYLIVNPFFHTFGYKAGILACLMTGATMVPEPVFDVDAAAAAGRGRAHLACCPDRPPSSSPSSTIPTARGSTSPRSAWWSPARPWCRSSWCKALWSDLGIETVLTAYGLTEATGTVTMCRRGDSAEVISATSGRAIPDVEVRIVDADGAELPRGEAGEIVVRGYNVMRGYFNDPEATDEAIDADGLAAHR